MKFKNVLFLKKDMSDRYSNVSK